MIARNEPRAKRLGQRYIGRVVRREVVAQDPYARRQNVVRIALHGEIRQISDRRAPAIIVYVTIRRVTTNYLRCFDIDQVRRVHCLPGRKQARLNGLCPGVRNKTSSIAEASTTIFADRVRRAQPELASQKARSPRNAPAERASRR